MYQTKQIEYGNSDFFNLLKTNKEKIERGINPYARYADEYFNTVTHVLDSLPDGYLTPSGFDPKNAYVRMQVFMRHPGGCLVAGVDIAVAIIVNAIPDKYREQVFIEAIDDGTWVDYSGRADDVTPVINIVGPYRFFAQLETAYLGVLSRCTRIANHVLECLNAANGTPVLFFPQRFDIFQAEEFDGYAYWLSVKYYNKLHGTMLPTIVSSEAGAALFGKNGKYQGSTPHALSADFGRDEVEAMIMFGKYVKPDVKRIFLADFNNDVIMSTKRVAIEYWSQWLAAWKRDNSEDNEDLKRWKLWGIRIDTSASLIDRAMVELGQGEGGVSPMLVEATRHFLDHRLPEILRDDDTDTETYQILVDWCRSLSITVTGGFGPAKIQRFEDGAGISQERIPVDAYGVGSSLLSNDCSYDFTADIATIVKDNQIVTVSKVGRAPNYNPNLKIVNQDKYRV